MTSPALVLADEPTGNLDTTTSDEIMLMFSRLNAEGRTIVLITHENEIASFAKRIVRLRDGVVIDDRRRDAGRRTAPAARSGERSAVAAGTGRGMNPIDTFRIAWRGATANKLRSLLTILGVMIGVSAVIILLAVGTGSSRAVQARINQLGTNTITVLSRGRFGRGPATTGTQSQTASLTSRSVTAIEDPNQAPDVRVGLAGDLDDPDRDLPGRHLLVVGHRHDPGVPDGRRLHGRGRQPDHDLRRDEPAARRPGRTDGRQQPLRHRPEPARPDDPDRVGELSDRRRAGRRRARRARRTRTAS